MSGIGTRLLLTYESNAVGNANSYIAEQNRLLAARDQTFARGAQAQTTLGRMSANASVLQSKAMQSVAQSTFRYTFYAMMALRAGQALATKVFAKGLINAAEGYEEVWTRVGATLQTTKAELVDMQGVAFDVNRRLPFAVKDIGNAMLEMARAGMKLADIKASIHDVGRLAQIAGVGLADAGTFVVQMLNAYAIKAEKAYEVTNLLAYYQDKATYTAQQLMEILGGVGGTAAAYGQNIAQVMQLATAFGAMGTAAGEADTLIRQLYMNVAKPQVYEAMTYGLADMGLAPLYNEYGQLSNVGEAFLGFSKFLDKTLQETPFGEERAEMAAKINEVVYQLFGVRSSRAFFQIAKMPVEDFKALYTDYQSMVQKASDYTDEYIARLKTGYQFSKQMARAAQDAFVTKLGAPMLGLLKPLNEVRGQVALFGAEMLSVDGEGSRVVSMVLLLTSAMIGLAGATGVAAGTYMLLRVRLADYGQALVQQGAVAGLRAKGYFQGIATPTTAQVGLAYFRSIAAGPMRFFSSAALIGGAAYLAYKKNFLGARTFGQRMVDWWNANMRGTETLGERLAKKIKEYSRLSTARVGPFHEFSSGSGFAWFIKGFKDVFAENGLIASVLKGLKPIAVGFKWAFENLIWAPIKFVAKALWSVMGWFVKWAVGWGDKEKGIERLGNAVGVLVATIAADRMIQAVRNLSHVAWRLFQLLTIGNKQASGWRSFGLGGWTYRRLSLSGGIGWAARGTAQGVRRGIDFFAGPSRAAKAAALAGLSQVSMEERLRHSEIGVGGRKMTRQYYSPIIEAGKVVGYTPMKKSMLVDISAGGRVAASVLGERGDTSAIASNLERTAAFQAASRATRKELTRTMWAERFMRPVNWARTSVPSWWNNYEGTPNRARHLGATIASWQGSKLYSAGRITEAQLGAQYGGAIGTVGAVSTRSMLSAVLPYVLGALAIAGIVALIVSMFRGPAKGSGTTNVANVTINGNVGANTEQITAAVQQGLASAARQTEIAQAESAVRRGYLQPEMAGA